MKRYVIFHGDYYYPSGGFDDYHSDYDNLEKANEVAKTLQGNITWVMIVDIEEKKKLFDDG